MGIHLIFILRATCIFVYTYIHTYIYIYIYILFIDKLYDKLKLKFDSAEVVNCQYPP